MLSTPLRRTFLGFITLRLALAGRSGLPESGFATAPQSPPLAAYTISNEIPSKDLTARREGAAYTITEECERLFCETLKAVFLGEGNLAYTDSRGMETHQYSKDVQRTDRNTIIDEPSLDGNSGGLTSSQSSLDNFKERHGLITEWLEVYDYVGGAKFRGFVTENEGERALFIFFEPTVLGSDLKPGLVALLELCSISTFDCIRLLVCLDRHSKSGGMKGLLRDLGWVGFEPLTIACWTNSDDIVSDRWIFLGMDV